VRERSTLPYETLIDGEVVTVDENGLPSFRSLRNFDCAAMSCAFPLPALVGEDNYAAAVP